MSENPVFSLRFSGGSLNVRPPSVYLQKRIFAPPPGVLSCHTTYTLSPSDEICGLNDTPVLSLMFCGGSLNVRPPSVLLEKKNH